MVEGKKAICFLDSGAWVSYLNKVLIHDLPVTGKVHDYSPELGPIEADEKQPEICIGHLTQKWPVGEASSALAIECSISGVQGVLGIANLFRDKILFDFNESRIYTDK